MSLSFGYKNVIGVLSILVGIIFFMPGGGAMEVIYGHWIYPIVRWMYNLISWIPIPVIYIFLLVIVYGLVRWFRSKGNLPTKLFNGFLGIGTLIALFYWLWAFNYRRTLFSERYPLTVSPLDSISLRAEFEWAKSELIASRPNVLSHVGPPDNELKMRAAVKKTCVQFGYSSSGIIRVKALYPKGLLLRIKTAGFYMPYTGEAYVDAGLHPIQMAYTQAHEMCHGYGVTDEGACNFLGYLAVTSLADSTLAYSGHMGYYRYVAGTYRFLFPDEYVRMRDSLPAIIKNDLDQINKSMMRYPDIFPKFRDMIYDGYLKAQGISEGMASYDKIIDYVRQYRISAQNTKSR